MDVIRIAVLGIAGLVLCLMVKEVRPEYAAYISMGTGLCILLLATGRLQYLMEMIQKIIAEMPEGEISVNVKGKPEGEFMARVEQPRGESCYYVKGNGTKNLERMRVRTPTNINVPFLVSALAGCELADVPVIVLSIDPCISCTER